MASSQDGIVLGLTDMVPRIDASAFLALGAVVVGDVTIAALASVWYAAVVRGDSAPIEIGEESNVQDGSVLHADPGAPLTIGRRVTVGHRVVLHGATVEDGVLIGMGCVVMNGARIGTGSVIGAGAVVTQGTEIPPGSLVLGAPARVARPVNDGERAMIEHGAKHYVYLAEAHRQAVPLG
ncbi:gamma carbonic anhydrase family protein [Dactylosporangium sp. CA-092794]|uniref:gamma carbonic anhydrase family protein n=1 Tax=Dactylosporangium sp. CA-092794 TaxID=3239929 RepID=UPI003D8EE101